MRKTGWLLVVCVLMMGLCLAGCGSEDERVISSPVASGDLSIEDQSTSASGMRETLLYVQNENGQMVPVMKEIPWTEGIGKAALEQLVIDGPGATSLAANGLKGVIPPDTDISLSIKDGVAEAVFSKEALELDSAVAEKNFTTGVVNTLTEFPTIDEVKITVQGSEGKLPFGSDLAEAFSPMDLNVETMAQGLDINATEKVTVFFLDQNRKVWVPVTRLVPQGSGFEGAVEEIIKGPDANSGLISPFPEGVTIKEVRLENGAATVNFSKELNEALKEEDGGIACVKALVLTSMTFGDIQQLNIQVEGKNFDALKKFDGAPTFANIID